MWTWSFFVVGSLQIAFYCTHAGLLSVSTRFVWVMKTTATALGFLWRHPGHMRRVDILTSIGLLAFVALMVFVIIPREAGGGVWHGLSPYFYPAVMLAGVALSSLGLLYQALTRPSDYEDQPKTPMTWPDLGFFLLISTLIFASVLVMHAFGTWAGGITLMASTMIFMGEHNPLRIVVVALPTIGITYMLVTWVLKIPLP